MILLAPFLPAQGRGQGTVRAEFFYEEGCRECGVIERDVFPRVRREFEERFALERYDINVVSNYMRLFQYQVKFGRESDEPVSIVVDGRFFLSGQDAISTGLTHAVAASLASDAVDGGGVAVRAGQAGTPSKGTLSARAKGFSLPAVVMLGALDGFNPCSFAAVVFLGSLLGVSGRARRDALLFSASFCAAAFITYVLIGLGLLQSFRLFCGFSGLRDALRIAMGAVLVLLSLLSFADALRFHRSGKGSGVLLKLPPRLMELSHRVMMRGADSRHLLAAGFATGAAVTAIESVCTGQLYIPTLAVLIRSGGASLREYGLLLAYNTAFVLPLVCVCALFLTGAKAAAFVKWSRLQVVASKVALGVAILVLAVLTFFIRG